jgi:hypothetical protein
MPENDTTQPKGQWGGRREGSGRPSGSRNFTTVMRDSMLAEIRSRTHDVTNDLFRAQLTLALGYSELWKIEKELVVGPKGGQKYVKKKPVRVTDNAEIEDYLCALVDEANGVDPAEDDSEETTYYYIVKVPPNNAALEALQERTLGKVPQQVGIGNPDGSPLSESTDPAVIADMAKKLNDLHRAAGIRGDGALPSPLGREALDQDL